MEDLKVYAYIPVLPSGTLMETCVFHKQPAGLSMDMKELVLRDDAVKLTEDAMERVRDNWKQEVEHWRKQTVVAVERCTELERLQRGNRLVRALRVLLTGK